MKICCYCYTLALSEVPGYAAAHDDCPQYAPKVCHTTANKLSTKLAHRLSFEKEKKDEEEFHYVHTASKGL